MDRLTYPKSPFLDQEESSSQFGDTASEISYDEGLKLPDLKVKTEFPRYLGNAARPALRFDLPSPKDIRSPFMDPWELQPGTPLQEMYPPEDEPTAMKRLRWGTTRTKTGRPKKSSGVGRSKTLRKIWKGSKKAKELSEIGAEDSLDIIDDYASDPEEETLKAKDERDRKHEKRTIVFNRKLPADFVDEQTGNPILNYPRNKIRTAKYTALTFLPKTLSNSFRTDIANNYFLFLIILGCFAIFGVTSPVLAAVPLIVIVTLSAIKEAIEDSRRTALDMEVNNQLTHILTQVRDFEGFVYENCNANDDNVSLWRRFKKWNTKVLFRALRGFKRNLTKTGRAEKARESALPAQKPRASFDSAAEARRNSVVSGFSTARPISGVSQRKSRQSDHVMSFAKKHWKEVRVGDIVRVQNNEEVPADIMILSSSDEDNCCFVETKNLDGETNLKVKQALKFSTENNQMRRANDFRRCDFEVDSEGPHPNLYAYEGCVKYGAGGKPDQESATINNLLLRGCFLRNTKWVIGIVVYTGSDTKIILNSGLTPSKKSRISRELNYYVIINFVVLFILCFLSGLLNGIYYRTNGVSRDYFEYGSPAGTPALNGLVTFFVAVILYQALVPISLYITIEIVKSFQAYLIYCDVGLYYEKLDFPCNPKLWSISDDLGQVEYIFSDKTGTLTQNLMEFRKCTINGKSYGRAYTEALAGLRKRQGFNVEEESQVERAAIALDHQEMLHTLQKVSKNTYDDELTFVSKEMARDMTGESGKEQKSKNEEFWLTLALCHSVLTEDDPTNSSRLILKAQSPDEAALVGTARALGFAFSGKTKKGYILRVQGEKREYQVLNTLEFNSTRKRMSAIVKLPSDSENDEPKVLLLCKGADLIIYSRLSKSGNDQKMLETTLQHLEEFATEGLRTLCIAKRELTWAQYVEWNERHLAASSSLKNREEQMEEVADSIERELTLLGGTAIEDRLQDGVPDSIAILGEAGIKLWVLTGDKVETAINIGFSCNLLGNDMELLVIKPDLNDEEKKKYGVIPGDHAAMVIEKLVSSYLQNFQLLGSDEELEQARKDHSMPNDKFAVIIDGDALKLALADPEIQRKFLLLCKQCKAVLCCRVSPAQKAAVVKMVKNSLAVMTLAIGDGSNDVAMIQAADVGVGIAGEEGRQAAMSSDYALGQFRFLTRLLLTHGRWSYKRFSEMIPCFFYKNINFTLALFWYSTCNNFDGLYLFEYTYLMFYNLAFTAFPVILLGVFDQDVSAEVSMVVPQLYRSGIMQQEFTERKFWVYLVDGVYQSLVSFFFPYLLYIWSFQTMSGLATDHRFFVGILVTCISCFASNFYVLMHQYRWDWASALGVALSCLVIFAWTGVWTSSTLSGEFYHAALAMFGMTQFWACLTIGLVVCLLPRFLYDVLQKFYFPLDCDIVREQVKLGQYNYPQGYDPTDPKRKTGLEQVNQNDELDVDPDISRELDGKNDLDVRVSDRDIGTGLDAKASSSGQRTPERKSMRASYYDKTTSIIETYKIQTNKLSRVETILLEDLKGNSQQQHVRTSLELDEFPTAERLVSRSEH